MEGMMEGVSRYVPILIQQTRPEYLFAKSRTNIEGIFFREQGDVISSNIPAFWVVDLGCLAPVAGAKHMLQEFLEAL